MSKYAAGTSVPVERSRAEIERILIRYGADQFMFGWEAGRAAIRFRFEGKSISFELPLPEISDESVAYTKENYHRSESAAKLELEKQTRQRWRALVMVIKAKLEAVESGITSFEDEFLAHILLPDGSTVGKWAKPQLEVAYSRGVMPSSLLRIAGAAK